MTQPVRTKSAASADDNRGAHEGEPTLDFQQLACDLFEKVAASQLDLLRAQTMRDFRAEDEQRLRLRGAALLLACLPAHPDSKIYRLKVLAATALREEDGAEASHAWPMVERALELDQRRQQCPVMGG